MVLTLVSRGNLWFTKRVGNNQFKGFFRVSRILGKRERNGNGKRERKRPTENA